MIFNGRFLDVRVTGVQRFAREILWAGHADGLWPDARLLAPRGSEGCLSDFAGHAVERTGRFSGVAWEQLELPLAAHGDFLVNLCCSAPVAYANQLLVLHDIIFARYPRNYTLAFRGWYHVMTRLALRHSRRIATVSKASARDIASYFDFPLGKIEVIPESGEHILRAAPDDSLHRRFGLERDRYILAASSLAPNKNFGGVIKALESMPSLPMPFVVVGAADARIFNGDGSGLSGAIEAGYVTDGQLRALYEGAACFVYPSFYEGFGLPPLEAMSCGCPVLVSKSSSLPEVCGSAALYCDPASPLDIADKLSQLLMDPQRRAAMRLEGLAHAASFTWGKGAHALGQILASAQG